MVLWMLAAECPASVPRAKKKGLAMKLNPCIILAGGRGFEPRLAESESVSCPFPFNHLQNNYLLFNHFCTRLHTAIHGHTRSICSGFAAQCSVQWNRNIMLVIVFFRYPLATFPGIWCHTPRGIAPAPAEATSLFSRGFPPPHHRCGVTEGRQTTNWQ